MDAFRSRQNAKYSEFTSVLASTRQKGEKNALRKILGQLCVGKRVVKNSLHKVSLSVSDLCVCARACLSAFVYLIFYFFYLCLSVCLPQWGIGNAKIKDPSFCWEIDLSKGPSLKHGVGQIIAFHASSTVRNSVVLIPTLFGSFNFIFLVSWKIKWLARSRARARERERETETQRETETETERDTERETERN